MPGVHTKNDHVVLMSACIAPKVGASVGRMDPRLRLEDYKRGLKFWMEVQAPRLGAIVFADNSGYPLAEIKHFAQTEVQSDRPVEFISFDLQGPSEGLSYGYNEFILVDKAHDQSELLAQFPYFIKATGRYRFPSIAGLMKRLPAEYKIAADCKGLRPFGIKGIPLLTIGLLFLNVQFYREEIRKIHTRMVPAPPWTRKQFVETMLFDLLYQRRNEKGVCLRWPCNCDPEGIGSNGDDYRALGHRFNYAIRGVSRVFLPKLWI